MDLVAYSCSRCPARYIVGNQQGQSPSSNCLHCGGVLAVVEPGQGTPIPPFPEHAVYAGFRAPASDPAPTSATWRRGEKLLDEFIVEDEIGSGGMGVVYLVHNRSTGERFAVKKRLNPRGGDERFQFLAELWTWTDLPDHPHIVACRFMRTIGDETVIFSEYVAGNSLKKWIADGKLTSMDELLDVAIQFAWGLHAAHEAGLVHQDVKPGNALLTADRQLKVSDFGQARLLALAGGVAHAGPRPKSGVTAQSGTEKYQSPEQAEQLRVNNQTDVWSWGVSILHLFNGQAPWDDGQAAPTLLDRYLSKGPHGKRLPPMPRGLVDILRQCFRADLQERLTSLAGAAATLTQIYRDILGKDYPRAAPPAAVAKAQPIEYTRLVRSRLPMG